MTSQSSEILEVEHSTFSVGDWRVFGVIRGEPSEDNHGWGDREARAYQAIPIDPEMTSTANWNGYTAVYRLTAKGQLVLLRFEFSDLERPSQIANETLTGDFYVVLKSDFEGPRMYLPFRNGTIVLDRSSWLHEAYVGNSPIATELRGGCHPEFPGVARLWYEHEWPPDTERT